LETTWKTTATKSAQEIATPDSEYSLLLFIVFYPSFPLVTDPPRLKGKGKELPERPLGTPFLGQQKKWQQGLFQFIFHSF
jgi:hypothetical protein